MTALKVGVVGTGNIFKSTHLPAWLAHPEIELAAFSDINVSGAKQLAAEHGVPQVYGDYRELIARDDIDIVDICTANLYHSEIAIAALQAGKHVFCEKPDAVNPEEALKMQEAAKASGKVLMVMRNNRFRPISQFIKRYVDEGYAGECYTGRCGWIRRRGIPGKGGWFTTKELSGGGPLIDLGVHYIDLALWFMGNPKPVAVSGATYSKFAGSTLSDSVHGSFGQAQEGGTFDVEDLASGFIRFENGATLQIEFSWASNIEKETQFLELRGTQSGIQMINDEVKMFTEMAGALCDLKPSLPKIITGGHAENINHFIDVVLERAEPIFEPGQGVDMIKVLCAIYESAKTGREVRLD